MTKLLNTLKVSFKNIINNKLRSALTMLGLIIGIASVITLVGIGNGTSNNVMGQVQSLGTDILTLSIKSSDSSIDYENIDEIKSIQNVDTAVPYKTVSSTVSRGETVSQKSSIIATTADYFETTNTTISEGRLLSDIDIENSSKVCLLGSDIAETLFSLVDPVGQTIKLNGDSYKVIGILTTKGTSMGNDVDNTIIIPFTTAKYLGSDTSISNLYIKVSNEDHIDQTTELIENYIENTVGISEDYFSVSSQESMLETMNNVNSSFSLLLGGIASISLIVGGIGVMNVMLVSVTERTGEIGIRKSLGAKRKDILVQFLIEALILSLIGGLLGVVIGLSFGEFLELFSYDFNPSTGIILLAFFTSAAIGLIFGIFPAYKAAKLNPIEALRTL